MKGEQELASAWWRHLSLGRQRQPGGFWRSRSLEVVEKSPWDAVGVNRHRIGASLSPPSSSLVLFPLLRSQNSSKSARVFLRTGGCMQCSSSDPFR